MKASMQKLIAMGLCVVLAVGSLTGCGGSSNDAGSASGDGAKTSSSSDKKTFSDLGGMDITVGDGSKQRRALSAVGGPLQTEPTSLVKSRMSTGRVFRRSTISKSLVILFIPIQMQNQIM